MRGLNNRQTTVQRMRAIKRRRHVQRKGAKRRDVSRRPTGK
jgi:hypothetical protein